MRELVRQDHFNLSSEYSASSVSERRIRRVLPIPVKRGIRLLRAIAQRPLVYAHDAGAGLRGESGEPVAKLGPLQRLERVEQRQQNHRREIDQNRQ